MGKKFISFLVTFAMSASLVVWPAHGESSSETKTTGLNNNLPTQEEIVNYLNDHDVDQNYTDTYSSAFTPREDKSSYDVADTGELTEESQKKALKYLNAARYIAGVDPTVTLNSEYEHLAQCSAYLCYLRQELNHKPDKTANISQQLFDDAYDGSFHGNLSSKSSSLKTDMDKYNVTNMIDGWLFDSNSESNRKELGHRRWCLNPTMGETGFGRAQGIRTNLKNTEYTVYCVYGAMYAHDRSNTSATQDGIAWPAANMPVQFFKQANDETRTLRYPEWSYMMQGDISFNDVKVTLILKKSKTSDQGKTWNMTTTANSDGIVYTEGKSYADGSAVIFNPNNISIHAGDVYNVKITGIEGKTVDYDVHFFDCKGIVSVKMDQNELNANDELALPENSSYNLADHLILAPKDSSLSSLTYSSDDTDVVTVNSDGKLTAKSIGGANITVTADSGVTCTVKVKVISSNVPDPTGNTLTYNGEEQWGIILPDGAEYDDTSHSDEGDYVHKSATNVGDYIYLIKLKTGFTWADGSTGDKQVEWSIVQAANKATTFVAPDVTYPEPPKVNVKLEFNDDQKVIEYKASDEDDDAYSTTVPTKPGTYNVRVTCPETDNVSAFSETKTFAIKKAQQSDDVTMDDLTVTYDGEDHSKDIRANTSDDVTYSLTDSTGEAVSEAVNAGTYTVTATIHKGDGYEDYQKKATLKIEKAENKWKDKLSIDPSSITYGDDYDVTAKSKFGHVTISYEDHDGTITSEKPTKAGTYTVYASVDGNDNYTDLNAEKTFTIKRKEVTKPEVTTTFTYDGEKHQPATSTDEYTVSDGASSVGKHECTISLADPDNYIWYDGSVDGYPVTYKILYANGWKKTLSQTSFTYGDTLKFDVEAEYGDDSSVYTYYQKNGDTYTKLDEAPSMPGDYAVQITIPETDSYEGLTSERVDFTITKRKVDKPTVVREIKENEVEIPILKDTDDYEVDGDVNATSLGDHTITVKLFDPDTTCWSDGSTDNLTLPFTIVRADVQKENSWIKELKEKTFTYGDDLDFDVKAEYGNDTSVYTYYQKKGNDYTELNEKPSMPGNYAVLITIPETDDYEGLTSERVDFTITKRSVDKPTVPSIVNADEIDVKATSDYAVGYPSDYKEPGERKIYLYLNNPETTCWSDGSPEIAWVSYKVRAKNSWEDPLEEKTFAYGDKLDFGAKAKYNNDTAVYTYYKKNGDDYTKLDQAPTKLGSYAVSITIPQTDDYEVLTSDRVDFTITKREVEKPTVASEIKQDKVKTSIPQDTDDYKVSTEDDDLTSLGGHTITVSLKHPETTCWKGDSTKDLTLTFTVVKTTTEKKENQWVKELKEKTFTYGEKVDFDVEAKEGNKTIEYTYYKKNGDDYTKLDEKPTMPGDYAVKVTIPETDDYEGLSDQVDFTIEKREVKKPTVASEIKQDKVKTSIPQDTDDYKVSTEDEDLTSLGEHTITVKLNHPETTCWSDGSTDDSYPITFTIISDKVENSWVKELKEKTFTYGDELVFDAEAEYGDNSSVYTYYQKNGDDYTKLDEAPFMPGDYAVQITIPETDSYEGLTSDRVDFTITKRKVNKPTVSSEFEQDQVKTPILAKTDDYDVSGDVNATSVGTHTITVTLTHPETTCWSDGSTDDLTYTFTIKAKATTPENPNPSHNQTTPTQPEPQPEKHVDQNQKTPTPAPDPAKIYADHIDQVKTQITGLRNDQDIASSTYAKLRARSTTTTKTSVKVTWNRVKNASKYLVFGGKCGKKYGYLTTVSGTRYHQKKLKKGTYYKYLIVAVDSTGKTLATSKVIHVATKGGKAGNTYKVKTVKKVTLKKGKSKKLKVTLKNKGKLSKHRKVSFESVNSKIATVSKSGKIKGKKKGKTTIYVYAQNGVYAKVFVTVK